MLDRQTIRATKDMPGSGVALQLFLNSKRMCGVGIALDHFLSDGALRACESPIPLCRRFVVEFFWKFPTR